MLSSPATQLKIVDISQSFYSNVIVSHNCHIPAQLNVDFRLPTQLCLNHNNIVDAISKEG